MNFVSVEAPAASVALARQALELLNTALWIIASGQDLQVIADELIEALA